MKRQRRVWQTIASAACALGVGASAATNDTPKPFCVMRGGCYAQFAQALMAVRDRGEIEIAPGRHRQAVGVLTANGVTIRSRGPERAVLVAEGAHAEGKAILVIRGSRTRIENLGFEGAKVPHGNGAGIRLEGAHLLLDRCLFDANEMGLMTARVPVSVITISNSEFRASVRARGPAHNIYIGHAAKLEMRGVWSHGARLGHTLKSRARFNDIQGSYFSGRGGTTSYEVEFPIGGSVLFAGNFVEQVADNDNDTLFSYGAEFGVDVNPAPHDLYIGQNTFLSHGLHARLMRVYPLPDGSQPHVTFLANAAVGWGLRLDPVESNISLPRSALAPYLNCQAFAPETPNFATPIARFEYRHPAAYVTREDTAMGAHKEPTMLCGP